LFVYLNGLLNRYIGLKYPKRLSPRWASNFTYFIFYPWLFWLNVFSTTISVLQNFIYFVLFINFCLRRHGLMWTQSCKHEGKH